MDSKYTFSSCDLHDAYYVPDDDDGETETDAEPLAF